MDKVEKKDQDRDPDLDRKKAEDDPADMRKANENIRKSQGDDAGQRPTIDRHR